MSSHCYSLKAERINSGDNEIIEIPEIRVRCIPYNNTAKYFGEIIDLKYNEVVFSASSTVCYEDCFKACVDYLESNYEMI